MTRHIQCLTNSQSFIILVVAAMDKRFCILKFYNFIVSTRTSFAHHIKLGRVNKKTRQIFRREGKRGVKLSNLHAPGKLVK